MNRDISLYLVQFLYKFTLNSLLDKIHQKAHYRFWNTKEQKKKKILGFAVTHNHAKVAKGATLLEFPVFFGQNGVIFILVFYTEVVWLSVRTPELKTANRGFKSRSNSSPTIVKY